MVETIAIEKITLYDLERRFNLQILKKIGQKTAHNRN